MKVMVANYTFDASAKEVTFTDKASINLEEIYLITNVKTGTVIYQFNNALKGGTVATNVLTLTYDTTAMADTDELQIIYDDPDHFPAIDPRYSVAVEYNGDGNVLYFGRALPGSAKSSAVWQVRKFTYSGQNLTDVQWADGNTKYDNVWNDRASLSYS